MRFHKKAGTVLYVGVEEIRPNPRQPRRSFDPKGLEELADSIRRYGVLQPLTVRRLEEGFELVAGERRLRAAKLAGLHEVPCIVAAVEAEDSALLALVENLQRRDLGFFEEAEAMARLMEEFGLTQEEVAQRVGKSPSAVANKLRLLRLGEPERHVVTEGGLSERHARSALRLADSAERLAALEHMAKNHLTVAAAEAYVERRLRRLEREEPRGRATYVIKDVRLFLNSLERGMGLMRRSGVEADWDRRDTDSEILLTIRIPKTRRS